MSGTIIAIGTAVPDYQYAQADLCDYMAMACRLDHEETRKLEIVYNKSAIAYRHSVLADFKGNDAYQLFSKNSEIVTSNIEDRLSIFKDQAPLLAMKAIEQALGSDIAVDQITHLITVSCTGMSAPGLEITLMKMLKLKSNIKRTSINFMGCYAAMHGLQQADNICKANNKAVVLVVCVELCTLHFQNTKNPEHLIANALFADGAAATVVVGAESILLKNKNGLRMQNFCSKLIDEGSKDMAWDITSNGFIMQLSAYIPQLVEQNIKEIIVESISDMGLDVCDIKHFAVHPGGKKILEKVEQTLELNTSKLKNSYQVLKNYGNMSSPTILFVLKEFLQNKQQVNTGEYCFAIAFGPGLVMESAVLQYV